MSRATCSMLLYCHSVVDKPLFVNAMGHSAVLSGISSHPHFMPALVCNRPAPRLTPEAYVSRYIRALVHCRTSYICLGWSYVWPYNIDPDTCHSRTILFLQMWVSIGINIPQHSLVMTYTDNWVIPRNDCNSFLHLGSGMVVSALPS